MTNEEVGRALREIRHQAGVQQDLVAKHSGYEQPHISRMEYGLTPVTMSALCGYAKATHNIDGVLRVVASVLGVDSKNRVS